MTAGALCVSIPAVARSWVTFRLKHTNKHLGAIPMSNEHSKVLYVMKCPWTDAAYVCTGPWNSPSYCEWMIPGTCIDFD
jgi:hypothetical protein